MTREPHLCIFTSAHPIADVRVYSRMARSFLDAGYAVSWVGPDRRLFGSQDTGDQRIEYHLLRDNDTKLKRVLASHFAMRVARRYIHDVDWWYCPDPDAAAVAEQLAGELGGRVVFDIHEAFDKGVIDRWFGGRAPGVVKWLVRRRIGHICRNADVVTGVNETVLEGYASRGGRAVVTRLCAPAFFADQVNVQAPAVGNRLRMIHGKAIAGVGTEQVLDAVQLLSPEIRAQIEVTMIRMSADDAGVPAGIRRRLDGLTGEGSVELVGRLPHNEMPELLARHRIGLIAYQRDFGVGALPNRLFEYMAAGLAIIAPSYSKEIVPIIEKERIGLLVDFEKPEEIAKAMEWLAAHPDEVAVMGRRARQAFLTTYNWDEEFAKLLKAMRDMESSISA